jgi:hypothetical protein
MMSYDQLTPEEKQEMWLRLVAMSMEENLNKLVEIGQATRDEQGRYTLNIAADNREIVRRLVGLSK